MITDKQKQVRQNFIGASDASAAIGINPYKTAYDLWLEKTGQKESFNGNELTYWGNMLEFPVANRLSEECGFKFRRYTQTVIAKDYHCMGCHLDFKVTGKPIVVEIKTGGFFTRKNWGESGTDQIPDDYLIQVQHQLICTGYRRALIGVLLGGQEFRHYSINFDEELARVIIQKEVEFWKHVTDRTPPLPINLYDIAQLYPSDLGKSIIATPEIISTLEELKAIKTSAVQIKNELEGLELKLKSYLADNSNLTDSNGKILATWKNQTSKRLDSITLKKEQPEIASRYLKPTESRVLRIK